MSKQKKPRKLRRPNVPLATGPTVVVGGGPQAAAQPRPSQPEPAQPVFDYTYVKKDLVRIGVLAGSFIAILVLLSFFIK